MKKFQAPLVGGLLLALCAYTILNAFVIVDKGYAYIETETLFNGFKLTGEYKAKLQEIQEQRTEVLDSMEVSIRKEQTQLSEESTEMEINAYNEKLVNYQEAAARFEEQNQVLAEQYDQIIWKQLNAYIKEYGDEGSNDIILGVSGQGNVMYANEGLNLTEEVLDYINRKYDGE